MIRMLIFSVMAGVAPEGSQFDARQYDAKMSELYVFLSSSLSSCNIILFSYFCVSANCVWFAYLVLPMTEDYSCFVLKQAWI